jgi:hypothetical protein
MCVVLVNGGRYVYGSTSLAPEALDQLVDVVDPPGCYPGTKLDRLRERAPLHLPPQRRGGKWEDRWNQLGLADIARFRQRADRVNAPNSDRQVAIAKASCAIAERVSLRLPSVLRRRG